MKKISLLILVTLCSFVPIQEKKITKTGTITFEASVPSFEEVKGKNTAVTCILNTSNGEIAALALMKGFRFKIALMEEHFNENYMESSKYPKATFKGKIENFDISKLTATTKEFTLKGKLELHGKSKDITTVAKIKKIGTDIEVKTTFPVNVSDFEIEIPSVVSKKVAKKVSIDCNFLLK
ncbi:YceI family protein [Flavobacterium sp. F372]|uniref:YceI family protein n=1 Tax=Flavobacterium bernardetii TaxID=2813823 RepID=A0ABR7IUW0_9FLAO|nr:YceI family protein [Flavobacterium bernardetii]MBC5833449.1 YceI family protein [Flavobacterium bernardetii]NHF68681.1 YceI family protein [Flavobacterium bernardetii]